MALAPLSAFHIQHCIEGRSWNSWTLDTMSDEWKPQQSLKNPMRKKMCACCFESLLSTSSPMTNSYTCLQLPLYPIKQVCNGKISEGDPEVDIHKLQYPFFSLLCYMSNSLPCNRVWAWQCGSWRAMLSLCSPEIDDGRPLKWCSAAPPPLLPSKNSAITGN